MDIFVYTVHWGLCQDCLFYLSILFETPIIPPGPKDHEHSCSEGPPMLARVRTPFHSLVDECGGAPLSCFTLTVTLSSL